VSDPGPRWDANGSPVTALCQYCGGLIEQHGDVVGCYNCDERVAIKMEEEE